MSKDITFVTQPSLPQLEEFMPYLEQIWENKWLTNNGPMHKELENRLAEYLKVPFISLFCNGMAALQTTLNCLRISGEVITTPYTFVATTHAISLHGCKPVFCDIDPETLNIDANKIEDLITEKTSAIMAVHVYGRPCATEKIEAIANKYNLKVIYDAAHAFGVEEHGESILKKGDLSMLSFHATKVFNTIEGGAVISHDKETKTRIDQLKNFGIQDEESTISIAGNGKMNEIQAAFGLMQLKHIDKQIANRRKVADVYRQGLVGIPGLRVLKEIFGVEHNYSYFPVIVEESATINRDQLYDYLKKHGFYARKYFYPLVSDFPIYSSLSSNSVDKLEVASQISSRVLCLPLFSDLDLQTVKLISERIKEVL